MTELEKLVLNEAENLKKYATKSEISNLDFETLDPEKTHECIYGQMTGSCFSERSLDLIVLCSKRVYDRELNYKMRPADPVCAGLKLNGKPVRERRGQFKEGTFFSPIEVFISKHPEKSAELISFIKGETDNLF